MISESEYIEWQILEALVEMRNELNELQEAFKKLKNQLEGD